MFELYGLELLLVATNIMILVMCVAQSILLVNIYKRFQTKRLVPKKSRAKPKAQPQKAETQKEKPKLQPVEEVDIDDDADEAVDFNDIDKSLDDLDDSDFDELDKLK